MNNKPNILVVCGRNKRRSRTAESIFSDDMRFNVRSVGFSSKSKRQIIIKDVEWSDLIFIMEDWHWSRLISLDRTLDFPPIEVLHIEDQYEYLDPELIEMLTDRINATLKTIYKI